ncbi:hypothetical protein ACFLS9_10545 [Bacteroidota bacterium]
MPLTDELLFGLVIGAFIGIICVFLAKQKNRDPIMWFILGLIFNILALVAIGLVPYLDEETKKRRATLISKLLIIAIIILCGVIIYIFS